MFQIQLGYPGSAWAKMPSLVNQMDSEVQIVGTHIEIKRVEENVLGRGGFGVVWRGFDNRNNKPVAVKQVFRNPETEKFCNRELRFMRECKHPNIVQFVEHFVDDSSVYFILELCSEGNLDQFVKDKYIALATCLDYMTDICKGIAHLHQKNIAHRDLKPANVLVKDNVLKVADLGLAKEFCESFSGQSGTGGVGTEAWMAPELCTTARRPKYDKSIDIFSLALLFLALFTHQRGKNLTAHTGIHFACDLVLVMTYTVTNTYGKLL